MPIHFEDRQAKYPNRWTAVKEDGTSEVITLVRNDEPIYDGTPMNAETLNSLSDVAGADLARAQAEAARTEAQNAAASAANSAAEAATSENNAAISKSAAQKSAEEAAASAELAGTRAGTDKTLSVEDAPADAKKVGDELAVRYTKKEIQKLIEDSLAAYRAEEYAKIKFWVSDDPTSPASFIGGTWERIEGEFILGASDAYPARSTGGEAEVTLIEDQLPVIDGTWMCPVPNNHADNAVTGHAYGYDHNTPLASWWGSGSDGIQWGYGYKFGGGMPHNNLPPYYSMYIWHRVA